MNSIISSSVNTLSSTNNAYTDLSSVHAIRSVGLQDKSKALDAVAKQFESMMVRMMLKSMRDANTVFAKDNFLSSHEGDTYQQMYDDQLAVSLTEGRGIGLAEIMAKQLKGRFVSGSDQLTAPKVATVHNTPLPVTALANKSHYHDRPEASDSLSSTAINFDGSVQSFVNNVHPLVTTAAKKLGVDPDVLLAQAALETGWGRKISQSSQHKSSFNLFNIKADKRWQGETVTVPTIEFHHGLPVKESAMFRSYLSLQHSVDDYVAFISDSPRYAEAVASGNNRSYIQGLKTAGYATDPEYAKKILKIANSVELKAAVERLNNTGQNKI